MTAGSTEAENTEHKKPRHGNDWTPQQLQTAVARFHSVVTIPVHTQIKGNQTVLSLHQAKRILESAERIALMDCTCRKQRNNCDAPTHTCLRLNQRATQALESPELRKLNPHLVSVDEALNVLHDSHRSGLIHMAIAVDQDHINEVCSCCTCCCMALSAATRPGLAPHLLTHTSVASTDHTKCVSCGACTDRCRFHAREMTNGHLITHPDRCIGCGLCASTCPTHAVSLAAKANAD